MYFQKDKTGTLFEKDRMSGNIGVSSALPAAMANGMHHDESNSHENQWYNQDFEGFRISEHPLYAKRQLRIVCVGAGATGLQFAYKAERLLEKVDLQIYEKNSDIGGTWLENRYPGCTCDIPSHAYQFTWARNPHWSRYYSSSAEIWQYFKDIATKFNLEKYIKFKSSVKSAIWNEEKAQYDLKVETADGTMCDDYCDILISGSGILNSWKYPDIPGLDAFKGKLMHSAAWDPDYDLSGKTVAVIGGGSSAVQLIPSIQPHVQKMTAFLRSGAWITANFGAKYADKDGANFNYSQEQKTEFEKDGNAYSQYCRDVEGELNRKFSLLHTQDKEQLDARSSTTELMAQQLNADPRLTKALIPKFALGCRRMTPGSGYLTSLTKDNVETIHESVVRLTETGVVDESGREHQVDVVVCATGFDTSFTPHFELHGRQGADIKKQFGDFPVGYLGITVENFPNFFSKYFVWFCGGSRPMLTRVTVLIGPNGPASHGSLLQVLEWYTRYVFQMIDKFQSEGIRTFEVKGSVIKDHYNYTHELMKRMVWSSGKPTCLRILAVLDAIIVLTLRFVPHRSMSLLVQKWQSPRARNSDLSRESAALFRAAEKCTMGGLRSHLFVIKQISIFRQRVHIL